jgi:hypothetical protein
MMSVQKLSELNFSRINTNQAQEVSINVDVEGTFTCTREFYPLIESISRRQSVDDCVSVVNTRQIANYCKMTKQLKQQYCIKFCQKLGDTQVETIR